MLYLERTNFKHGFFTIISYTYTDESLCHEINILDII